MHYGEIAPPHRNKIRITALEITHCVNNTNDAIRATKLLQYVFCAPVDHYYYLFALLIRTAFPLRGQPNADDTQEPTDYCNSLSHITSGP
jgi:hypothetical protein